MSRWPAPSPQSRGCCSSTSRWPRSMPPPRWSCAASWRRRHLEGFAGISILVTHDPVDAAALAQSVVVLDSGRIAQAGTLAEITARPRSRYVADLAGVNLWRGAAEGGRIALSGGATLVAASDIAGEVYAMVAPRSVALYQQRPQGTPRNVWQGRVTSLEAVADRVRGSGGRASSASWPR